MLPNDLMSQCLLGYGFAWACDGWVHIVFGPELEGVMGFVEAFNY